MTGTLRMASAATKQLLRSSEVIATMIVFPAAILVVLALFSELRWESPAGPVPLIDFLGNFPQAFSHIGLINAAWAITEAERAVAGSGS